MTAAGRVDEIKSQLAEFYEPDLPWHDESSLVMEELRRELRELEAAAEDLA